MADLETSLGKNQVLVLPKDSDFKPNETIEPPPLVPVSKKRLKNEIKEETSALERVVRLIGEEMIVTLPADFFGVIGHFT